MRSLLSFIYARRPCCCITENHERHHWSSSWFPLALKRERKPEGTASFRWSTGCTSPSLYISSFGSAQLSCNCLWGRVQEATFMRPGEGHRPHGPHSTASVLNKQLQYAWTSPAEQTKQLSRSCHGASRLLSISEWVHHNGDSVSTSAVRRAGKRDGRAAPSDTAQVAEAEDPSLSKRTKLAPPLLLLRMALHQEDEICRHRLPQKINFIRPSADQ